LTSHQNDNQTLAIEISTEIGEFLFFEEQFELAFDFFSRSYLLIESNQEKNRLQAFMTACHLVTNFKGEIPDGDVTKQFDLTLFRIEKALSERNGEELVQLLRNDLLRSFDHQSHISINYKYQLQRRMEAFFGATDSKHLEDVQQQVIVCNVLYSELSQFFFASNSGQSVYSNVSFDWRISLNLSNVQAMTTLFQICGDVVKKSGTIVFNHLTALLFDMFWYSQSRYQPTEVAFWKSLFASSPFSFPANFELEATPRWNQSQTGSFISLYSTTPVSHSYLLVFEKK